MSPSTTVSTHGNFIALPVWGGSTVMVRVAEIKRVSDLPEEQMHPLSLIVARMDSPDHDGVIPSRRFILMDDGEEYRTDVGLAELQAAIGEALEWKRGRYDRA